MLTSGILVLAALSIWVCVKTILAVYHAFFGPLSQYPGPKLNALTRLVLVRHKFAGHDMKYLHELHLKYGPVVRVTPNMLSYIDGRAFKEIYGRYSGSQNGVKTGQFEKDPEYYCMEIPGFKEMLLANDSDHARMRRNFSNAFSDKALRRHEETIQKYVHQFCSLLDSVATSSDNKVDVAHTLNYVTFDIMADLSFGEPLGCLETGKTHPWVNETFSMFKMVPIFQEMLQYPWLKKLIELSMSKAVRDGSMVSFECARASMDRKMARDDGKPDIWGTALHAKDELKLTVPEIYGNCRLMMTGGTETTASLLTGLLYYLLRNPEKMAILVAEVRGSCAMDDDFQLDTLSQLKYLNACIEEGLRLFPPIPSYLPRMVPSGGAVICDKFVPENTAVAVPHYAAFHNPTNFHRPDDFVPERWLGDPAFAADGTSCFMPFSTGPRACLGKNLAYLEMRLILASLVRQFDFAIDPSIGDWLDQKAFVAWEKPPLILSVQRAGSKKQAGLEKPRSPSQVV